MDIIPNKKSRLLYQRGDQKTNGVIDLRGFSLEKKHKANTIKSEGNITERKHRVVSEIIRKEEKNKAEIVKENEEKQICAKKIKRKCKIAGKKIFQKTESITKQTKQKLRVNPHNFSISDFFLPKSWQKSFLFFVLTTLFISSTVFFMSFVQKGIEKKGEVLGVSAEAYGYLKLAGESASNTDFEQSIDNFNSATLSFANAKEIIDDLSMGLTEKMSGLPINTPISTAQNLASAGENISMAGKSFSELFSNLYNQRESFSSQFLSQLQMDAESISLYLQRVRNNMENVDLNHIPENLREKMKIAKEQLPLLAYNFENLSEDLPLISEILGSKRPQKYLLLFENNSEIRASGGFIGSYGILDIEDGKIKNLFIEGIFNPDGQLKEKVVPPIPIQKISAAWSMHDANWFADFPTSAKKVALFYEKTGNPTVDGVIAITPNVLEDMLKITGPIEMEKYGATITAENFLLQTQLQVEELYDKEENKPKKFLSELAPKIIENILDTENLNNQEKIKKYLGLVDVIEKNLKEKHIILYHRDSNIENMLIKRGWGGQILNSSGDYLSVVHSNINGYKTDAVIDEQIFHNTEILNDGSIVNIVRIVKKHMGGKSDYDWYNRVNTDYMRVYVPMGSILLEASGHTWEEYEPPIDYGDFKTDPDVFKIESTIRIDPETGTHIFEESGKTVFGNWVYVSPGETVEVMYKYRLPYKIDFDNFTKPADRYSILIQKQLGSKSAKFYGSIKLPYEWRSVWRSENLDAKNYSESIIRMDLTADKAYGVVFKWSLEE